MHRSALRTLATAAAASLVVAAGAAAASAGTRVTSINDAFAAPASTRASSSPSTDFPECPRTITDADNGATITLAEGTCATLSLDPDFVWSTPVSSGPAVRVFDHETFVADAQWGLRARQRGSATITATGRPDCDVGEVCPLFIRLFSVHIRVAGPHGAAAAA
jgi:hypothetical protein